MPTQRNITIVGDLGLPSDLPSIMSEIRRLARLPHRTAPEDVRFAALCARSKSINAANRAAEARAAKRSTGTTTPTGTADLERVQADIARLEGKGASRTLNEDAHLRGLRRTGDRLRAERVAADSADVARAAEKVRARRATRPETIDASRARPSELRDAALAILERSSHRLTADQGDHVDHLLRESTQDRDAATIARKIVMTESDAYRSGWLKSVTLDRAVYTPAEASAVNAYRYEFVDEMRAMSEAGSAGLAIPALIDPTIVPSAGEVAPIVAAANVKFITSNVYKPVSSDGTTWAFQSEGSVVADGTPTLAQRPVDVQTARAFIPSSEELAMDYPGFADEFARLLSRGYADILSQKSAVGSGSGEPFGVFTTMANITTSPSHVTVTTAGHIGAVDVRAAWDALPERFTASASWVMHRDVLAQVRNFAGAASQVDLVVDRQGTTLMGRPVITSSYCPDFTGTTGAENFLVVGDLSGYTVAQRVGVTVELVPQMRDTTGRPLGQRGWFAYARVGADVTVPSALRLLANS